MKNLTLIAIAAIVSLSSCDKEDVTAQSQNVGEANLETFNVTNMFVNVEEENVQIEACEPLNAEEVQVSVKSITVSSYRSVTFEYLDGSTDKKYFEFVEDYRVYNEAEDGGGYYYTEALQIYNGDTLSDNYILLLDFCDEDGMTFFFTQTGDMIYTVKQ